MNGSHSVGSACQNGLPVIALGVGSGVARVVHEDVDRACVGDHRLHGIEVGDVGLRSDGTVTRRLDLVGHGLRPVEHEVVHDHVGSVGREVARRSRRRRLGRPRSRARSVRSGRAD